MRCSLIIFFALDCPTMNPIANPMMVKMIAVIGKQVRTAMEAPRERCHSGVLAWEG